MKKLLFLILIMASCNKEEACPCVTAEAPTEVRIINPPDPDAPGATARTIVLESFAISMPSCTQLITEYENPDGTFSEYFTETRLDESEWLEVQSFSDCR